jgi:hypothetical protein
MTACQSPRGKDASVAENAVAPSLGMVARLTTARGEELCLLRHVSPRAATIQIYSSLQPGEAVRVYLADGTSLSASVVSRQESLATLEVHADAPPAAVAQGGTALPPRLPRLDVGLPAQLRIRGQQVPAILCNISQGGAKIRAAGLSVGLKVGLLVGGLPPLVGRVRWMKDDGAGMSFYDAVPLDILAPWSAALGAEVNHAGKVIPHSGPDRGPSSGGA